METGKQSGFTLIEALLVISILAILVALVLPSYQGHLSRAGRLEARQELVEVAADLERYHSRNGRYVEDARPMQAPPVVGRRRLTRAGHYEIQVQACPELELELCFLATARAQGRQLSDSCQALILYSDGARGAEGDEAEVCWRD